MSWCRPTVCLSRDRVNARTAWYNFSDMGERRVENPERADHETLSAADTLAFLRAYEAAQRRHERLPRDRAVEALWGAKRKRFLEEVSRERSV